MQPVSLIITEICEITMNWDVSFLGIIKGEIRPAQVSNVDFKK